MTAIKGMAILIIIMGHLGNIFGVRVFNPLGSCGVAIFLFCSGYGLQKSYYKKNLKEKKRCEWQKKPDKAHKFTEIKQHSSDWSQVTLKSRRKCKSTSN